MTHPKHRAGHYVTQATGYRAFIPAPLSPDPPVVMDTNLQVALSEADRSLGRLDGSIHTLPNPDLFVLMYVRKEAVLSSQIEGTQSSLQDVLAAEAKVLSPERPRDVAEVVNYVRAMRHGLSRLAELPVSVRLIREIHEQLLRGVRGSHCAPGELRRTQNWVGPAGCSLSDAAYVPPPPHMLASCLSDLERFLHTDTGLPLLVKVGLAHAQFETIHPFLDGNGRVGRLLITFLLCEQEVLVKPALYLSHYFREHRQEYYDHLQAVREDGTWEAWLLFFLTGIAEVSRQATETARRILELREQHRDTISQELGRAAGNGHRVLDSLYQTPIVSVNQVSDTIGATYQAANGVVARLVDTGILREVTGRTRNRRFIYHDYVKLFSE